jgi:NitT/TauT family transport system substrate-binding protein
MTRQRNDHWSRRRFLETLAVAGTGALLELSSYVDAADPAPETTKIRLIHRTDALCLAPRYVAEELLRMEGFTEVEYVKTRGGTGIEKALASGQAHLSMHFAPAWIARIEAGDPIVIIGVTSVVTNCSLQTVSRRYETSREKRLPCRAHNLLKEI